MAARRLLIIMLILLGISSVIAIALPKPDRDDPGPGSTAVTGATGNTGSTGDGAAAEGGAVTGDGATAGDDSNAGTTGNPAVVAGEGKSPGPASGSQTGNGQEGERTVSLSAIGEPVTVKAGAGSRLILTVESETGSEVEIGGLGLTGFADSFAPAVFDLILPTEAGRYPVRAPGGKPGAVIVTS